MKSTDRFQGAVVERSNKRVPPLKARYKPKNKAASQTTVMNPNSSPNKASSFLKEVRTEVKKVSWPTRQEVFNYTLIVIISSVVVAMFLGGLDIVFQKSLKYVLQYLPK